METSTRTQCIQIVRKLKPENLTVNCDKGATYAPNGVLRLFLMFSWFFFAWLHFILDSLFSFRFFGQSNRRAHYTFNIQHHANLHENLRLFTSIGNCSKKNENFLPKNKKCCVVDPMTDHSRIYIHLQRPIAIEKKMRAALPFTPHRMLLK